jgi:hypothetical protein
MACFTFNNLLSSRAYNFFHKIFSFTPLIRAFHVIGSINFSVLSIFLLNLFKFALVDLSFVYVILKSLTELFPAKILILKHATSLVQRSLKLVIESSSRVLYHALTETMKVVERIFHMI